MWVLIVWFLAMDKSVPIKVGEFRTLRNCKEARIRFYQRPEFDMVSKAHCFRVK